MSSYGAANQTPHLDALAERGTRFETAYSHTPLTLPAHASMLTGRLPHRHGVRVNGLFELGDEETTLAEILAANGYRTGAVISTFVLDRRFGLAQGFEVYDSSELFDSILDTRTITIKRRGKQVTAVATALLEQWRDEPFFIWAHYYDPHRPHQPPSPWDERYEDPYHGEIAYMDDTLGDLFASVDRLGLRDNTLIVVTSDHGEAFGEHGEDSHGILLYEETQRIPLILSGAGIGVGVETERAAALVDLLPTVLARIGIDTPTNVDGSDLFENAASPANHGIPLESHYALFHYGAEPLRAVIDPPYKLIESSRPELYDLGTDPGERRNLIDEHASIAARMRLALPPPPGANTATRSLSVDEAARLEALGYATSSGGHDFARASHPLEVASAIQDYEDGVELLRSERFSESAAALESIVAQFPQAYEVHSRLAYAFDGMGRDHEAIAHLEIATAGLPGDLTARRNLASLLARIERFDEAEGILRAILRESPNDTEAWRILSSVYSARGDLEGAARELESALLANPDDDAIAGKAAAALDRFGVSLGREHRYEEAEAVFLRALALRPEFSSARYHRAVALLGAGRSDDARRVALELRALDPEYRGVDRILQRIQATE